MSKEDFHLSTVMIQGVTLEDFYRYSECGWGDPLDGDMDEDSIGIGDLTCEYNAHSALFRCAVHPGVETCEGCHDHHSVEVEDRDRH